MNRIRRSIVVAGVLGGLLAQSASLRAAEKGFDAPEGVTLQVKTGGRYLLLWDPIGDDAKLMGYSIWLRRKGEKEFVRLSVPVKVGKEIQKQPMISEAKLELKLGEGRKDLEFAVVAEYEDGPSPRSASAFSLRAMQAPPAGAAGPMVNPSGPVPLSPPAAAGVEALSPTATAEEPRAKPDPYADEDQRAKPEGPAPWDLKSSRLKRPLLPPPGKWHTSIGASYEIIRTLYQGKDPFGNLGLIGTDIPDDRTVTWKRVDMRTRFKVPLRAELGVLPGVGLWAEGAYHAEDVTLNLYTIDGENFNYIRPVRVEPDGSLFYYPDPSSVSVGDTQLGAKLQPITSQPLILGATVTLPTGISRFKSYIDYLDGRSFQAGTGDGATRLAASIAWGWRALRPGASFRAQFSPGTTERFEDKDQGFIYKHVLNRGDEAEAGFDYTFPWNVTGRDGALLLGATGRSINAARWTINGIDMAPYYDKLDSSRLAAHAGIKFSQENQLEIGVEAVQDLPGGFETGGRLSYTTGLFGDELAISGRLVY